jgi:hypothetical protein
MALGHCVQYLSQFLHAGAFRLIFGLRLPPREKGRDVEPLQAQRPPLSLPPQLAFSARTATQLSVSERD